MSESIASTAATLSPDPVATADADVAPSTPVKRGLGLAAWLSIGWLTLVAASALLQPFLPLEDPYTGLRNEPRLSYFEDGFLLGTDDSGRDVLSRTILGGQSSLMIAVMSISIGTLVGGLVGLISGYVGGKIGNLLAAFFDILLAFPPLLLALTLVSVLSPIPAAGEPGLTRMDRVWPVTLAVGLVSIPVLARITRATTLSWSQREFVMAARAQGAKSVRIMFREVLPNVIPAMLSISLLGIATVIIVEGGLAIFGLSIITPNPSWGNMIASQVGELDNAPNVWLVPSVIIFFTVLALNFLGDVIRERFSVREAAI